jgi:hypothetical protein
VAKVCQCPPAGDHHAVHQGAGDAHQAGVEAARLGQALHLHDDHAAGVARRRGDRQRLEDERLALHGDVAVGVRGGAAQDRHVDRQGAVEEVLLAAERDRLDEVLGGARVDLAAAVARIDEGVEAHARDGAGLAAAMSRKRCEITPWGRLYASILFSSARRWSFGQSPQCPPITRRTSPSWPRWLRPRSFPSPWPAA